MKEDLTFGDQLPLQTFASDQALEQFQSNEGKVLIAQSTIEPTIMNQLQNDRGGPVREVRLSSDREDISEVLSVNTPF